MENEISIERQIECVRREIKQRTNVYPRFIAMKRYSQEFAAEEIAAMKAVLHTLESLRAKKPESQARLFEEPQQQEKWDERKPSPI